MIQKKEKLQGFVEMIHASSQEMRSVHALTGAAMLTGMATVLNRFTISFSETLRLSFGFLAMGITGMLYGPILAGMMGVAVDLLRYLIIGGGAYFPGFTINQFLVGFLYGLFLYKRPITVWRIFLAKTSITVLINLCLTPLWLSILYGDAFIILLSARIAKNLIMLPLETAMLYLVCKRVKELRWVNKVC